MKGWKHFQFGAFSQTPQTSQESFPNKQKYSLLVVMSAVDWWKSPQKEALIVF
jgi:hypothetical protein